MTELFFPTNEFTLLESCQLYIIAKYKATNCCKREAVIQRCSVKQVFLKILQNLQENPCAKVSFLIKLQLKKRLWRRCFPVSIAKLLRTPFFIEYLRWLPLVSLWNQQTFSSSYFWLHLISWGPSKLRQNSCQMWYPHKNICGGVHSYCNSNCKTFKLKYKQFAVIYTQL